MSVLQSASLFKWFNYIFFYKKWRVLRKKSERQWNVWLACRLFSEITWPTNVHSENPSNRRIPLEFIEHFLPNRGQRYRERNVNKSEIIAASSTRASKIGRRSADGCTDSVHSILIGRLTKQRLAPLSATPLETDRCSVSSTPYNYRLRLNGLGHACAPRFHTDKSLKLSDKSASGPDPF